MLLLPPKLQLSCTHAQAEAEASLHHWITPAACWLAMFIIFTTQLSLINFEIDNCIDMLQQECVCLLSVCVCVCLPASQNGSQSKPQTESWLESCVCVCVCALLYVNAIKISTMQTFTSVATNVDALTSSLPLLLLLWHHMPHAHAHQLLWQHLPGHTSATIWRFALVCVCLAIIVCLCNCICTSVCVCVLCVSTYTYPLA